MPRSRESVRQKVEVASRHPRGGRGHRPVVASTCADDRSLPRDQVCDARADSTDEMPAKAPSTMALRVRDRVALIVDAFAPLPATVAATAPTQATLVLDGGPIPARMLHRRTAAIETSVQGRRFRAEGALTMVASKRGKAREDAIAFHFDDGRPRLRPREDRAPAILPVTFLPMSGDLPPARGLTLNVSAGGALVRGPSGLPSRRGAAAQPPPPHRGPADPRQGRDRPAHRRRPARRPPGPHARRRPRARPALGRRSTDPVGGLTPKCEGV